MEIAIDISPLKNEHSLRGTGSYTKLLINALQKYEDKHAYHFFTRGQKIPENIDLVHYPYFDPFFLTLPLNKPRPVVVTVHDLIPIAYSEHFPKGLRGNIKWQIQRWSLAQAKAIITDSKASKADIASFAVVPQDKIYVVPLAPADIFKIARNGSHLMSVSQKYHLPNRFILYVGDVNWNKNLPGLVKTLAELRNLNLTLILVGKAFLNENLAETRSLNKLIHNFSLGNQIMMLGFVPDSDLVSLYNLASVYVQPSFAEGFGLPVLEAMACGCPTVVSRVASLLEIAGPSILVNPHKPIEMASGVKRALTINRKEWQKGALEWVKRFFWKSTAHQTSAIYEQVLQS